MAWFGDGLSSLSNLKGQITNFTKEVLSEGIVEELDDRDKQLEETNRRCVQLQELLNSRDAEIALLRRQNCELKKNAVETNSYARESNDDSQDDEGGGFFWDPPSSRNRESNHVRGLEEQIAQATVRIKELEEEVKKYQKISSVEMKEEISENQQRGESVRVKQDLVNRIIQIGEKGKEAERTMKKIQTDELAFINDFRAAISKLDSHEQVNLIRCTLSALEMDNGATGNEEKSDIGKKVRPEQTSNGVNNRELELRRKIKKLQEENESLSSSIEELDQQHAQSMEKVLDLKEELHKKHQCLQTAYETLYVDYNNLQDQMTKMPLENSKSPPLEDKQIQTKSLLQDRQSHTQEKLIQTGEDLSGSQELQKITEKVQEILKDTTLNIPEDKNLFEVLADEFLQSQRKKEMLERRISDRTRELNEVCEMRDALQIDCEDMQTTVDALESKIRHMKSNLPSIPEASEERVASLETETESMSEEIKRLQLENDLMHQKQTDLITTLTTLEGSLRNQENLEAEVRNTKQQLEIAQQQLAGASKNVENNENMMEDLSRRLHSSLEENNELRKRIDALEAREKQMQEQVNMYSEKCKGLDDNIDLIEELKLDIGNVRKELKNSFDNTKKLENELASVAEERRKIEREKEHLEAELVGIQENRGHEDDSEVMGELRSQLEAVNRERDDLEYDLLNMRKELDLALSQVTDGEIRCQKLQEENARLVGEHEKILEQVGRSNKEAEERIELLHTEMNELQQEHIFLQEEATAEKSELKEMGLRIHDLEAKNVDMEKAIAQARTECQVLKRDCDDLRNRADKVEGLEREISRLLIIEGELKVSEGRCEEMHTELAHSQLQNEELTERVRTLSCRLQELSGVEEKMQEYRGKLEEQEKEIGIWKTELAKNVEGLGDSEAIRLALDEKSSHLELVRSELETLKSKSRDSASMAKETIENLSQIIQQKEQELEEKLGEKESAFSSLKSERDELVKLVQMKHNESLQYHAEIQRMTQLFNEQVSNFQVLTSERDTLGAALKEKETEVLWAQNELQVVRQKLKNFEESNNYGETCNIPEHASHISQAGIMSEKCNALEAALVKEQTSNRILENQLAESQGREVSAARELERLRTHLMEVEASYTEEALLTEQSKKELEGKLREAEEKVKNSSTVYTSASIRANQQVETLQQQMTLIIQQRDDIQAKLSAAEDKVAAHTASLTNLQIVLEQFQRDKENDIRHATERIRQQLNGSHKKQEELNAEISSLKGQLAEAKECLQAASRLSENLDRKSDKIQELSQEVAKLTDLIGTADERIEEAKKSGEGKVDKFLIKNLLLGFLSSPASDKSAVLRVFGTILDFDEHEREKAGLNLPTGHGGWFSGLLSTSGTPTKDQEASLSQAFIRFLESESKPTSVPALPVSSTSISRPGHSRQHSTSSSHSGLLLTNVNLPSFQDFRPSRNTGSILKEVLKDS
ncbi:thyroid receptor-interacting protein 11 [Fopius arisanus]|uniref:Thyroid receptor-interacting protein 11 n=1 Tax=Fopius arisanus TaxID=64838 RepID=A0A9R1SWG1_9HYME|nr:PREDICTED: thyroid receptor-interacting protein 11 [Fopius arisanus]